MGYTSRAEANRIHFMVYGSEHFYLKGTFLGVRGGRGGKRNRSKKKKVNDELIPDSKGCDVIFSHLSNFPILPPSVVCGNTIFLCYDSHNRQQNSWTA